MAERLNIDIIYGYCSCGEAIYHKSDYCSICQQLSNSRNSRRILKRIRDNVDILTGEIYRQPLEDSV